MEGAWWTLHNVHVYFTFDLDRVVFLHEVMTDSVHYGYGIYRHMSCGGNIFSTG